MKFCSKCGKELCEEAVVCPNCGCAVANTTQFNQKNDVEDEVSIGFVILSVLIPLFGVIYWALKHKETPKKAKACGIAAIISWAVGILFSVISMLLSLGSIFSFITEIAYFF